MTDAQFLDLIEEMRYQQRNWFLQKEQRFLKRAKQIETAVDAEFRRRLDEEGRQKSEQQIQPPPNTGAA